MPLLRSQPSFQTLDRLHFVETGEHLSPIAGDACPHPAEWYILKTRERQQRRRLWQVLDEMGVGDALTPVKEGVFGGMMYNAAKRHNDEIHLYFDKNPVWALTPDGTEIVPPSSRAASPSPTPFTLRDPWMTDPSHPLHSSATEEALLQRYAAAKVALAAAEEELAAVQAEMRQKHVGRHST
jgi:hypothetical protein